MFGKTKSLKRLIWTFCILIFISSTSVWTATDISKEEVYQQVQDFHKNQEYQKAIDFLQGLINQSPDEAFYHLMIAGAYDAQSTLPRIKAEQHYKKSIDLNINNEMAYVGMASLAFLFQDKEHWFKLAIEKFPSRCHVAVASLNTEYLSEALLAEAQGNITRALNSLKKSKKISQNYLKTLQETPDDVFLKQLEEGYMGTSSEKPDYLKFFNKQYLIEKTQGTLQNLAEMEEILLNKKP